MCDYSLHQVATRQAQVADQLVTTKFPESITRGFAAVPPSVDFLRLLAAFFLLDVFFILASS